MEAKVSLIEPLFKRAEEFGRTSFELAKLKALDKTADVGSTLLSRLLLAAVLSLFVFTVNIGIALWLGDLLGKNYYGFLVVASFYGLTGIVLFFIHPRIKAKASNAIIRNMLN